MLLHIAICDDLPENGQALETMLHHEAATLCLVETQCFTTADELLFALRNDVYDIVFLDIRLGRNQDGIAVARQINALCPNVLIVFVTAYLQYYVGIYDASHIYFLSKPISKTRLRAALVQALTCIERARDVRFALPVRGGQHVFTVNELLYFERRGHNTIVHASGGEYVTPQKLSEIEILLPAGAFARPHNSYLVNLMQVCEVSKTTTALRDGTVLPISAAHKATFSEALVRSVAGMNG